MNALSWAENLTLERTAAVAQIASVVVAVLIAIVVYIGAKRSGETTAAILEQTRGLARSTRRSDLIREISDARVPGHLERIREEIVTVFPDDAATLLRIYYANPAATLPTWSRGPRISAELATGMYEDLHIRHKGLTVREILRDLGPFAEYTRGLDVPNRYVLSNYVVELLTRGESVLWGDLHKFLKPENLDIAADILREIERLPSERLVAKDYSHEELLQDEDGAILSREAGVGLLPTVVRAVSEAVIDASETAPSVLTPPSDHLDEDLERYLEGAAYGRTRLQQIPRWSHHGHMAYMDEVAAKFITSCSYGLQHSDSHVLKNYVLPLCLDLLRRLPSGRQNQQVTHVLPKALERFVSDLGAAGLDEWAERFHEEEERLGPRSSS